MRIEDIRALENLGATVTLPIGALLHRLDGPPAEELVRAPRHRTPEVQELIGKIHDYIATKTVEDPGEIETGRSGPSGMPNAVPDHVREKIDRADFEIFKAGDTTPENDITHGYNRRLWMSLAELGAHLGIYTSKRGVIKSACGWTTRDVEEWFYAKAPSRPLAGSMGESYGYPTGAEQEIEHLYQIRGELSVFRDDWLKMAPSFVLAEAMADVAMIEDQGLREGRWRFHALNLWTWYADPRTWRDNHKRKLYTKAKTSILRAYKALS